jgi:ATP-dependent Clp protease ATP-binding subunit ClpA
MFERFTVDARQAVLAAQDEARALHHGHIGPEHLLLGIATVPDGAALLSRMGLDAARLRADLAARRDPEALDEDALAALGIDVGAIRERVEVRFGPGALDRPRHRRRSRRRGTTTSTCTGALPFAKDSKKALELALRESLALGDRHIGAEHLLLALARVGAVPGADRDAVLALLGQAA